VRDKQLQTRRGLQKILPLRLLCSYRTGKSAGERARSLARRRVETAIFLACDRWKLATTSVDSKKTYHRTSMLIRVFFSYCYSVASPQATAPCADGAGNVYSALLLLICRVFFCCCDSVSWSQAAVWAPAWAPRSRTCDRSYVQRHHLGEGTSPRVLPCLCAHESSNIYSAALLIYRVFFS
jgi:hypothetical protein